MALKSNKEEQGIQAIMVSQFSANVDYFRPMIAYTQNNSSKR